MAAFVGKWKLTSSQLDNLVDFMRALGYGEDAVEMTKKANMPELNVVTEYSLSGDTFTDVLHVHDKEVFRHDFQMGKERKFIDKANRVSKLTTTVSGNVMTTKQTLDSHRATYINTVNGDKMTQTMETGSVKVVREMEKI